MMKTHTQCRLRRDGSTQVAWIPTEHATVGAILRIKEGAVWEEGWEVVEAYDLALPSAVVEERSRDYRKHRKATDI